MLRKVDSNRKTPKMTKVLNNPLIFIVAAAFGLASARQFPRHAMG